MVTLLGLDIGSTTCGALVSTARPIANRVTGRTDLADVKVVHRGGPVFTPFAGDALDVALLAERLDGWLAAAGLAPGAEIFGGGALVTGLAARAPNADELVAWIRARLGDAVVATARDPLLESWLAFMGSARPLSLAEPERAFVNLDIGGGTTNLALGRAGEVRAVACVDVGARHVRLAPGSRRVAGASPIGRALAERMGVDLRDGAELTDAGAARMMDAFVAEVKGEVGVLAGDDSPVITFSGGVGELVYRMAAGHVPPMRAPYGDLGVELARALLADAELAAAVRTHAPPSGGHATVTGLALASTQIAGASVYLPRPELLPLRDVPVVARLSGDASTEELVAALALVRGAPDGAAVALDVRDATARALRPLGERLADALDEVVLPSRCTLVLLIPVDGGKTLGSLATRWGTSPGRVLVIDELQDRGARFVSIGAPAHGHVAVSFRGLS